MPNKSLIAYGALALNLAYDIHIYRKNVAKFERINEENEHLKVHIAHANFMVGYLVNKLEQNEIEIDEFDLIALNNLM